MSFRHIHSSNLFIIHSVVLYDGDVQEFLPASIRYARKNLHFILFSVDDPGDFELVPVASFHPKLSESQRFYIQHHRLSNGRDTINEIAHNGHFIQEITDDTPVISLTASQMGILSSFYPPMKGYVMDSVVLRLFRKAFYLTLIKINDQNEEVVNQFTNLLMTLHSMNTISPLSF